MSICFLEIQLIQAELEKKKCFFFCKIRKFLHLGEVQKLRQDVSCLSEDVEVC